ncbi:peptidoglycan DD-metalloendopeptidase family protein [Ascidiimonas aurantiaca]|uniref:peptidoglycan DD-metalloendopeptidase family protein n=1 Tax=Ascidiimonas aurantiaca TaxID=1685432 RepID=UPI0030EF7D25
MTENLSQLLKCLSKEAVLPMDASIERTKYTPLDLSVHNTAITTDILTDPYRMESYLNTFLLKRHAQVAYGGYNENRDLYKNRNLFGNAATEARTVHLGMDFWCTAGTTVLTPLDGKVHSFKDNATSGDYGPTIILYHEVDNFRFYTLFGHLSRTSLEGLYPGKLFKKGTPIATLGTPEENVNYAPHLHFQIIENLNGCSGDYPGVTTVHEKNRYLANCPNPNLLFNLP